MTVVDVRVARTGADWEIVRTLFGEYVASLSFELTFQDVDREFADLPSEYGPPHGVALVARAAAPPPGPAGPPASRPTDSAGPPSVPDAAPGDAAGPHPIPVGAVGVRGFAPGVAELKRMFVRPSGRGLGAGHALAAAAVELARGLGHQSIRLDTLAEMTSAIAIYEALGFRDIPAYRHNPLPSARFFALDL